MRFGDINTGSTYTLKQNGMVYRLTLRISRCSRNGDLPTIDENGK
jgi:hypothetical protein